MTDAARGANNREKRKRGNVRQLAPCPETSLATHRASRMLRVPPRGNRSNSGESRHVSWGHRGALDATTVSTRESERHPRHCDTLCIAVSFIYPYRQACGLGKWFLVWASGSRSPRTECKLICNFTNGEYHETTTNQSQGYVSSLRMPARSRRNAPYQACQAEA